MKPILVLSLSLNIFQVILSNENQTLYRCGVDDEKIIPLPSKNFIPIKKDKRKLNDDNFKEFNIFLDSINIKKDIIKYKLEKYQDLFINSLNKGVETLKSLLKVKKLEGRHFFTDQDIKYLSIEDWNRTVIGSNVNEHSEDFGIDLFIFGRFDDQMNNSTLASAGVRYYERETGQPLIGVININANVNYSKIHSEEYFQSIVLHEFTHILGFASTYFLNYTKNIFSRKDSYGIMRSYINSPKVIEMARKYFNCSNIDGVELENFGGEGTTGSHWEARILLGEYMNGVLYPEEQVISEFTLALLEDSGYYKANYYTGGLMRFGKGKGCDFIKTKCVDSNHQVNPLFENEFYDSIFSPKSFDASCSSGRQSRTYYAWWIYENIPEIYQYFKEKKYGGFASADYCPVSKEFPEETINSYYTGHCSIKGSGEYGKQIKYNGKNSEYYTSKQLQSYTGETFSDHSFCYQNTLMKDSFVFNMSVVRAVCFESFCSSKSLTIKVNKDYFVCPRAGGKIKVKGYKGYFMCPDYNLICSGTVMCNDMFDCVSKKSETKEESYYYDYTIKTTQNIENIEIMKPDNETNYELAENGKCPINCKHCDLEGVCKNCRNDLALLYLKENGQIKCVPKSELTKGYYEDDDIYYNCIERCNACKDKNSCDECIEGYLFKNKKCLKEIKNCDIYGKDDLCDECVNKYVLKDNNRTECIREKQLLILQIQIINNQLKIFFIVYENIDEEIQIKLNITIYKNNNKNIRNIEEESNYETKEIILKIDGNNAQKEKIYELTSEEKFNENDRIVVNKNFEKNSIYQMKLINNDNYILDTEENKKKIENGEADDYSKMINSDYKITKYMIKSVTKGCEFNLISNIPIKENDENITLNFLENNSKNKILNINCTLSKENENNIHCLLEPEVKNNYTLDDYSENNKEGIFHIIQEDEKTFELVCESEKEKEIDDGKKKKLNIKIIIIIVCIIVAIIIVVVIIICCCCCNQKQETDKGNDNKRQTTNPHGEGDDPNLEISFENPSEKNSSQRKH